MVIIIIINLRLTSTKDSFSVRPTTSESIIVSKYLNPKEEKKSEEKQNRLERVMFVYYFTID